MRRLMLGTATCILLAAVSAATAVAAWSHVIHQVTDDELSHGTVAVAGRHFYWTECSAIENEDGSTSYTPSIGRYLDRTTGRRERIDPTELEVASLTAAGDRVVYLRSDESTPTLWTWNAVTGVRRALDTPTDPSWVLDTDGTYCIFDSGPGAILVSPLDGSECFEVGRSSNSADPAIDRGVACWTSLETSTGATTVFAHDIDSGLTASARIEWFSALSVDISGELVVLLGETPDYRSHLLIWNTRTGRVGLLRSSHPAYMSSVRISGTRVIFDELEPGSRPRGVRVLDLTTGSLEDVSAPGVWASHDSFEGSIVGMQVIPRGTRSIQAAWCDLDERPPAQDDDPPADERPAESTPGGAIQPAAAPERSPAVRPVIRLAQADGSTESTTTPAEESTTTPGPPAGSEGADSGAPRPGDAMPIGAPEPDRTSGISPFLLVALALAGLAVVGASGWLRARRDRPTPPHPPL